MGSEWPNVKIEDIQADVKGSIAIGPFGSRMKSECYVQKGVPVIRGTNITGGPQFEGNFVYITTEMADKLGSCNVYEGDLVFPHRGAIGEVGIVSDGNRYIISSSLMKLTCDKQQAEPKFVYYFFKSRQGKHQLLKNASQVGTPGIGQPLASLKAIDLRLPDLKTQRRIAGIMSSLDNKIALNHQINTTLESMAQALFKSWFVDFDPVIDNALAAGNPIPEALQARADARAALGDRRKPLPDHIRQQFPDRFVLTEEMGWVPEGWKVTPLSEAIEINPKVTIKKGQKAKHVDMKALPTSGYCVGEISEKEYAGGAKFERGDVLLARITPCLENGKTGVVNFLSDGEPGFGSTEFIVMRPKNAIGTSFVAALARQEAFRQHCISNMVGSSGRQRVQNSCFDTYFICTPKVPDILDLYRDNCEAWFVKMTTLANESRSLGLLRDTLLPKLLSGELRIPEAEKQVEEII
jgi:type I restriction enzyme, S subunit